MPDSAPRSAVSRQDIAKEPDVPTPTGSPVVNGLIGIVAVILLLMLAGIVLLPFALRGDTAERFQTRTPQSAPDQATESLRPGIVPATEVPIDRTNGARAVTPKGAPANAVPGTAVHAP